MFINFPGATGFLNNGPVGILVSRLCDGMLLESNEVFARCVGYSRHELIGARVGELGLWVDAQARQTVVERILRDGHCFNLPVELRRKNGKRLRVLCSALRIDVQQEPHILTLVRDNARQAVAHEDSKSEAENLDFVEARAGIGFWDFDVPSGLVRWSYGMEAIYGLPKGGFKGTAEDFISRIHPDDVARNLRESQQALDRKSFFDISFRIVRPGGAVRWINSRGAGRFDASGAHLGASGFQIDITEQVRREQQMQLQAQILTTMAEGVLLVGAATSRILFVNPRMEQMLGYPAGGLIGLHVSAINAVSDSDPLAVARAITGHMQRYGHWQGEVKNRCADGREIWTTANVTELRREGMEAMWISVHTDIHEKHQAQAARDEAMRQLQRLSLNIQDSLEAERLSVSRDVHDQLGAALTGMRMQLEALAGKLAPLSPALQQEALAIFEAAGQTQRAARDLCSRLRPALLDDVGLVEACRWHIREWARAAPFAVRTRLSRLPQEPPANIATDMFRVLQELLTNVARHSGARTLRITLDARAGVLRLRVQDDGCGFDPAQLSPGFGLMGVRERVRHHAGALHISSGAPGSVLTATMRYPEPA